MATISSEASTIINRPVAEVFAFLTDPTNEPRWHTDVIEAEPIGGAPKEVGARHRWVMSFMGRREQVMEITALEKNRLEVLRGQAIMGLTPTITYRFESAGDSTRFTRHIEMQISGIGRLFQPMLQTGGPRRNARFVENAKRIVESEAAR